MESHASDFGNSRALRRATRRDFIPRDTSTWRSVDHRVANGDVHCPLDRPCCRWIDQVRKGNYDTPCVDERRRVRGVTLRIYVFRWLHADDDDTYNNGRKGKRLMCRLEAGVAAVPLLVRKTVHTCSGPISLYISKMPCVLTSSSITNLRNPGYATEDSSSERGPNSGVKFTVCSYRKTLYEIFNLSSNLLSPTNCHCFVLRVLK